MSLKAIFHGGSPVATQTLRRAHTAFPTTELLEMYGATETAPIATTFRNEERCLDSPRADRVGSLRRRRHPHPWRRGCRGARRRGRRGRDPGDNVMIGYWNKPEQTAAALVDGWYHSGDLGYLDTRDTCTSSTGRRT